MLSEGELVPEELAADRTRARHVRAQVFLKDVRPGELLVARRTDVAVVVRVVVVVVVVALKGGR